MGSIRRVAVTGATGFVGFPIADALVNAGVFDVVVLVRTLSLDNPRVQELKARGAEVHAVSYDDEAQLTAALKGVEAVVSTLSWTSTEAQALLVKASAANGVKLFFPSEFALELATDTHSNTSKFKREVSAMAKENGLQIVRIFNGLFPEWYTSDEFSTFFGFRPKENKILIYGSGDEKNSWTSVYDVARFVAYILGNVPVSQLANRNLRIEGDAKSFNEFAALWEEKHKVKLERTYKPISELDDRIAKDPTDHEAAIAREMFSGRAAQGPVANSLYPEWNPKSVKDAI
ncbi:hypothetical protein FRC08_009278 [Ceratobasidium sp. 394]|nr:hypothetical protein FRC08_009278 [Ceratobasidium sp. 394]KAG9089217.1 hypothetical protein FS749_001523 [Ceratobasidium sp. UAMH 11750]